jgi:preprotein translocase subunit SecF
VISFFINAHLFKYGIDFTGGTNLYLHMPQLAAQEDTAQNRNAFLEKMRGVLGQFGLEASVVQLVGKSDVNIRSRFLSSEEREALFKLFHENFSGWELLEVDTIGPTIGEQLRRNSLWIISLSTVGLLVYITFRFEFVFGVAAIVALLHDAFVTLSLASLLQIEINTTFVAAILTILGYSINDTIVIFDRIREISNANESDDYQSVLNDSINQTLRRSLNTGVTTLLVIVSMYFLGGVTLREFSLVMFIGIVSGTYSSICNAAPLVYLMRRKIQPVVLPTARSARA